MAFVVSRFTEIDGTKTYVQDMHGPGSPYADRATAEEQLLRVQKQFGTFGAFGNKFDIREVEDKPTPQSAKQSALVNQLGPNENRFIAPKVNSEVTPMKTRVAESAEKDLIEQVLRDREDADVGPSD